MGQLRLTKRAHWLPGCFPRIQKGAMMHWSFDCALGRSDPMEAHTAMDLTTHWIGFASVAAFVLAYLLVIGEEFTHMRKSMPVMLAAGVIWALVGLE